jgi:excisionase family DNA binding protein
LLLLLAFGSLKISGMETDPDLVTVQEAAKIAQLSSKWPIQDAIRRRELPSIRLPKGRAVMIPRGAFLKWNENRKKLVLMESSKEYMTMDEIAEILRLKGPWAIRTAIRRRELPAYTVSYRRVLIPRAAFIKWLEAKKYRVIDKSNEAIE